MPDHENDGLGSYYILAMASRVYYYLDISEGDRIVTLLDALHDVIAYDGVERVGAVAEPMFVAFTDRSGSEGRIRAAQIEALYTSTPESRARDRAFRAADKAAHPFEDD
jgi:hypothetical protein